MPTYKVQCEDCGCDESLITVRVLSPAYTYYICKPCLMKREEEDQLFELEIKKNEQMQTV